MREFLIPRGTDDTMGSNEPPAEKEQPPEKLAFEESSGSLRYGRIPYEIRYDLNAPTSTVLNAELLGNWLLQTEEKSGPDSYVAMWVHESCPLQYKHIVMYHELVEAELELAGGVPRLQGHHLAVAATDAYAKRHLSSKEFEEYKKWERTILPDIVARRPQGSSPE